MEDTFCGDCNRSTTFIFEPASGDTVCTDCGLVVASHQHDDTPEWRDCGDDYPVRVASSAILIVAHGRLSGGGSLSSSVGRWQKRDSIPNSHLMMAFNNIANMSHRLGLVAPIEDRASEIFAACLYDACRLEDKPRTLKVCSVANGVTEKDIGRAKNYIVKQLGLENDKLDETRPVRAADLMRRFCSCSNLGMNHQAIKAAQEAAQKAEELGIRRSPISIAAALIYIMSQLSDDRPLRDISAATGVAEGTILSSYKDLHPHISKIIPAWYAKAEDVKQRGST
ncbi:hypothetical protein MLD38_028807 [Melastoma candidum]|uniref:Uncharacterized protein n=1 Tax=Melastoma candidum TaxID=119954 RepID=A0ACB9N225_9MYRT|nr:hypothetical protein MLD38_028807 [Melastoma candidum]